ncbi:hypothetical protein [Halobacillus litoralis]|uniref:hypothetical protein n=1 Tax=Halobacillus litoralis TaxID=45668 RepID=UPI001CD349F0|nr:hypothetical protein [Halobacillus litoralis]MCA1021578.1 hypothetical protein [Halobacillus litoralis]
MLLHRYTLVIDGKEVIGLLVGAWAFNLIPNRRAEEYNNLMCELPNPKLNYKNKQPISYFTPFGKQKFVRLIEIIKEGINDKGLSSDFIIQEDTENKSIFREIIAYEDEYQVVVLKEGSSLLDEIMG